VRDYIIHNNEGRILQTGRIPESMFELQQDEAQGRFVLEGSADVCTQYVVDGGLVSRPANPAVFSAVVAAADGTDEVVIAGVPAGARIAVTGPVTQTGIADGTDICLTFARPGIYLVRVESFPYCDLEVTIDAA
jgi:hypothetical protein